VLTGGGDAPGLNAAIRAVVKTSLGIYQNQVFGIRNGYEGLLEEGGVFPLDFLDVRGILPRGGTILGAANRGNPFAVTVDLEGEMVTRDMSDEVLDRIEDLGLDVLIAIGGDGTLGIARDLIRKGAKIIGVPKTIDNDVNGTEMTFGFDTAVNMATEALDRLHTTAEAHHRAMVLELMGRHAGFIALTAGVAGGADVILIPEIPFSPDVVCEKISARVARGTHFSILAVAEGARMKDGEQVYQESAGDGAPKLGGIGRVVAEQIGGKCGVESRLTVLGHLQRGGSPSAYDRWLASRFGAVAARLADEGLYGRMVSLQRGQITHVDLIAALEETKRVDVDGDGVETARGLGICMGDVYEYQREIED
jgi:6-phosphofructokinase 1